MSASDYSAWLSKGFADEVPSKGLKSLSRM